MECTPSLPKLSFTPQTRLKWLWVWFLSCVEMAGLMPVLAGIKGNLSSAVNYVTGNYVQITIKVWVLSSSRKVPIYVHKLLLSSSLKLKISGAACELCAPHNLFFPDPTFKGVSEPMAAPMMGFSHTDSRLIPHCSINSPVNKGNLLELPGRNYHI